jgi:hypothetical protein
VLLAACGSSAPTSRVGVSRTAKAGAASSGTVLGYELTAPGYSPVSVDASRPPPYIPPDFGVYAFRDSSSAGLLVVRTEPNAGQPGDSSIYNTVVADARRQAVFSTSDASYMVTQSNTTDAASVQDQVVAALRSRKGDSSIADTVIGAVDGYRLTGSSTDGAVVKDGYTVGYSNGKSFVSLAVYTVPPGTELALTDGIAPSSFVHRSAGDEWIVEHGIAGDPPRTHWIEGGFLLVLSGAQGETLRSSVTPIGDDPIQHIRDRINEAVSETALEGEVKLGTYTLAKRAGFDDAQAVCMTDNTSDKTACSPFFAVGSLGSLSLDGKWYIAAIVPAQEPTTEYRTDPVLHFESTSSDGWNWALALVPADVNDVTAFYGTAGIPAELSSELHRPG